jgi:hypothetical protein
MHPHHATVIAATVIRFQGRGGYESTEAGDRFLMDITATVNLFLVGAAGLGLWLVVRFPSFGPRTVAQSLLLVMGAFVVMSATDGLTTTVASSDGPAAALLLVVLPTLTLVFWACACLVRAFVTTLDPFRS